MPEYPQEANLVEFEVSAASSFRFFIDAASLSIGVDGVVRYTLLARSASGVQTVTYEGIRCSAAVHRIYALGRPTERSWSRSRVTDWKPIQPKSMNRQVQALWQEYFCPQSVPITSREDGINALKRGEHPHSGSTRSWDGRP